MQEIKAALSGLCQSGANVGKPLRKKVVHGLSVRQCHTRCKPSWGKVSHEASQFPKRFTPPLFKFSKKLALLSQAKPTETNRQYEKKLL